MILAGAYGTGAVRASLHARVRRSPRRIHAALLKIVQEHLAR